MKRRRFLSSCCIGCAGAVLAPAGAVYDAVYVEPNWPEITEHEVGFDNYPPGGKPLKIAQLSDFHRGPYISEDHIRKFVSLCNRLDPDVVLLTGDFISKRTEYAKSCAEALSGLKSRLGIFGVLGNHDYWAEGKENVVKDLESSGIRIFKNGNLQIAEGVWLVFLDDCWAGKPDIQKAFSGVRDDYVRIVATHSPKIFPKIRDMKVLAVVGHTHGGQYNIPPVPRKYLPGLLGWEYIKGWYAEGNSRMYVNRGIGMVTPPARFCCRPEITLFKCQPVSIV